jgi:hypothetical protein
VCLAAVLSRSYLLGGILVHSVLPFSLEALRLFTVEVSSVHHDCASAVEGPSTEAAIVDKLLGALPLVEEHLA